MGIMQRNILLAVLRDFAISASVVLIILIGAGAIKEALQQGMPLDIAIHLIPVLVPEMLRFVLPGCWLFAVCGVFGNRAAMNEFLALRAGGVSLWSIVWPVLLLSIAMSLATSSLYESCARWSRPQLQALASRSLERVLLSVLKDRGFYSNGSTTISVEDIDGKTLISPCICIAPEEESNPLVLVAQEADLSNDLETGVLHLRAKNGNITDEKVKLVFQDTFEQEFPIPGFKPFDENTNPPASLGYQAIMRQTVRENLYLKQHSVGGKQPVTPKEYDKHQRRWHRLRAEIPRRLANGFACLVFVMVGIPIAVWSRSSNNITVFFLCNLPVLLIYYPLLVTGETWAKKGIFPEISVWLADAALLIIGLLLCKRLVNK